jgi:hypothetical protein
MRFVHQRVQARGYFDSPLYAMIEHFQDSLDYFNVEVELRVMAAVMSHILML